MVRRGTTTTGLLATGLIALACGACSVLFSTSKEQCATDDDCRARGAGFQASKCTDSVCVSSTTVVPQVDAGPDAAPDAAVDPFACAKEPAPSPDPNRKVDLSIRYTDFTNGTPPTRTIARLCAQTDSLCNNPRTTLEGNGTADAGPEGGTGFVNPKVDGTVTARVEYGFEGFFELKSADYLPTYRYTSPPLKASASFEQLVLRLAELNYLSDAAIGKPNSFDSVGHGVVFVFARDCNQQPLPGVSFSTSASDDLMKLFYIINTTPSITDKQTDSLGRGGYSNVPPGLHTFTAENFATKQRIGSARILVRAGAATTVAILPSP